MYHSPLTDVVNTVVKTVTKSQPITTEDITRDVLANMDLPRLAAGGGVRTKDMTREERKTRKERLNDEARRKRNARKAAERDTRDAEHEERAANVSTGLYGEGLAIVAPTIYKIDRVVGHYGVKFSHVIGSAHLGEIATKTLDDLAKLVMADDKHKPDIYREAALYVATLPGVPDVPKTAPTGAARLASMLKRRAKFNLIDWHRLNPTIESIEMLETVAANLHMQVENMLAKGAELNRNPYPLPGKTNQVLFRMVVDAALNHLSVNGERLDWLLDLLLDERERDAVGRFKWREHGEHILRRFSLPVLPGENNVMNGVYAMKACQRVFATVPEIVQSSLVICQDPRLLAEVLDDKAPHHDRVELIPVGPTFELPNQRKHIIIPEPGTTAQLLDTYAEIETGLTPPQRVFRKDRDRRIKDMINLAAVVPNGILVSELERTFQMLLEFEAEQG